MAAFVPLLFFVLSYLFSICVWAQTCAGICVELGGQCGGTGSLLPSGVWGTNPGQLTSQQISVPTGPLDGHVCSFERGLMGWALTKTPHFCELRKQTLSFTSAQGAFVQIEGEPHPNFPWIHLYEECSKGVILMSSGNGRKGFCGLDWNLFRRSKWPLTSVEIIGMCHQD